MAHKAERACRQGLSDLGFTKSSGGKRATRMDPELETWKTEIDLRVFAEVMFGFRIDRKDSWAGSAVMRGPNNEKIAIKRDVDNHWIYYSFRSDDDNGTIIDLSKRLGLSLGGIRVKLREFMGQPAPRLLPYPPLLRVPRDRIRIERVYSRMLVARSNKYLENERCIPRHILQSRRFAGRIRANNYGSAVFPHYDAEGLSGFEIKGHGFTSFSKHGIKALWTSHIEKDDDRMSYFESSIDALSFATLFPDERTRFASLGGRPTPLQKELVRATIAVMPRSGTILAAMDADAAGRQMANVIGEAVAAAGRPDLRFVIKEPPGCKDWNDLLRARTPRFQRARVREARPS
jgi:hypothetical protein